MLCPECGRYMTLRDSVHGKFYGCTGFPRCRATHGAHPDGRPLGIPGDKATKAARIRAHEAFDRLWKCGGMRRAQAYRWLQKRLHMTSAEAHIGRFTVELCEAVIAAVTEWEADRAKSCAESKRTTKGSTNGRQALEP